jgi:SAM-dependent methyltransferase
MSFWDQRYAEPGFAYGDAPNDFVAERAAELRSPVLSLGEGEGRNSVFLAQRGLDVTAVDQSPVGLEKAAALAASRGVKIRTVTSDLAHFDIQPGAWGSIVSVWCHLPPPLRARVHAACVRGLASGGVFLLESYGPEQLRYGTGGPREREMLPSLDELLSELAGLEVVVGVEKLREVHEGKYHDGTSAVVQLLLRKP